ncbi:hypothetical protein D3C75_1175010 [compost metagenome]
MPVLLFDQRLHMGMTGLDLLPVEAPHRADTQQVQAGQGAVDSRLIVTARGVQQCLQPARPRLVQHRAGTLAAFSETGLGRDRA